MTANRLLALLPPADFKRIARKLEAISLPTRQILYKVQGPIDYVYFPTSGIISAMAMMEDGNAIEVATVGNEGMADLSAFVGGETSPYEIMVQVAGAGFRMRVDALKKETATDSPLRQILVKYHMAFATQVSYSVACNGLHKVQKRCCRWLLMTADRVGSLIVPLTHEFLAIMLGVRRSSVTEVLQPLQEQGLIRSLRGKIQIVDRAGLEAASCECYRVVKEEFTRLFG